jgi:hypothetical protein
MSKQKNALRHMSSHNKTVNTNANHRNFTLNAEVQFGDLPRIKAFMEAELQFYNQLVEVLGAQFNRDYSFFLDNDMKIIQLFGDLCLTSFNLYDIKEDTIFPDQLNKHKEFISTLTKQSRFILTEAIRNTSILPEIKKRMGMSILAFYITQAEIRKGNQIVSKANANSDFDIQYKVSFNTLTALTSFNKRHIQVDRKSCKFEVDLEDDIVRIILPYCQKPVIVKGADLLNRNWNYLILRQDAQVVSNKTQWVIDFKKVKKDMYMYKYVDRLGKSGIFELGKRLN